MSETGPNGVARSRRRSYTKQNIGEANMGTNRLMACFFGLFCFALLAVAPAAAQKRGGTLRLYHNDNPPSTSLHEKRPLPR